MPNKNNMNNNVKTKKIHDTLPVSVADQSLHIVSVRITACIAWSGDLAGLWTQPPVRYFGSKSKTKAMIITTSRTASVSLYPGIQRVETFKLLGIVVSNDLKWNPHIAYIIHKANSRLHFLRQLKRAAVPHHDMLHFYIAVIRSVLEYAVPVWHTGLTADLWSTWNSTKASTTYHIWRLKFHPSLLWILLL